jgi:tetratricopeptide (TPR) repeat protein
MRRRSIPWLLSIGGSLLAAWCFLDASMSGAAMADESGEQKHEPRVMSVELLADALEAAAETEGSAFLELAQAMPRDPWVIADELMARGARAVAERLVESTAHLDAPALRTWLLSAQPDPRHRAVREMISAATTGTQAVDRVGLHDRAQAFLDVRDPVLAIEVRLVLAQLSRSMEHWADAQRWERDAATAAESLGATWVSMEAWRRCAQAARARGDLAGALEAAQGRLRLAERRAEPANTFRAAASEAEVHLLLRDTIKAELARQRAWATLDKLEDGSVERRFLLALKAEIHLARRELDQTIEAAESGLAIQDTAPHFDTTRRLYRSLAQVATLRNDQPRAREIWRAAVRHARLVNTPEDEARALFNVAEITLALDGLPQAMGVFDEARLALGRSGSLDTRCTVESAWANTLLRSAHPVEAGLILQQVSALREGAGHWGPAVEAADGAAQAMTAVGRDREAADALQALRVRIQGQAPPETLDRLDLALARQLRGGGMFEAADRLAETVAATARARGDVGVEADGLLALAMTATHRGAHLDDVARPTLRAVTLLRAAAQHARAAYMLVGLAEVQRMRGDFAAALATLEDAATTYRELKDSVGLADALSNLATTYLLMGDFERAQPAASRALAASLGEGAGEASVEAAMALAMAHVMQGTPDRAIRMIEAGLRLLEKGGDRESLAYASSLLAFVSLMDGDLDRALLAQQRFDSLYDPSWGPMLPMHILLHAAILQRLGKPREAHEQYDRALAVAEGLGDSWAQVGAHAGRAALHLARHEHVASLAHARAAVGLMVALGRGLDMEGGAYARSLFADAHAIGVAAARELRLPDAAVAITEQGRAAGLLESFGGRETLGSLTWTSEQMAEYQASHRELVVAEARMRTARAALEEDEVRVSLREARNAARERHESLLTRMQRTNIATRQLDPVTPVTLEEIRLALSPGDALVLFVVGAPLAEAVFGLDEEPGTALIIEPDTVRIATLPSRTHLEAAFAETPWMRREQDAQEAIALLRRLAIEPLALRDHVRRVLISPHGAMHGVPLALALEGRDVVYVPSGTTYVALRDGRAARGVGVLAVGRPNYGSPAERTGGSGDRARAGLKDLPATEAEARRIGDVVLIGNDATESGVRRAFESRDRWRAVHFACHGVLHAARPALSALALTATEAEDGQLTALELVMSRWPADLAVLSGCETAKGRVFAGEGNVGLTHAFLAGGARSVLASLWRVDDAATQVLMEKFYALWNPRDGSKGMSACTALRLAQAHVQKHDAWRHPYYWAAWTLWGVPDP